jgi:drug/metabolite transporter (DMT)-like permease
MSFFVILLPFFVFAALSWLTSVTISLFVAAATALALIVRERLNGESAKILNIATVVIFGGLGVMMLLTRGEWSATSVRMATNAGLLIVVLTSIALRFPFTLQYAREQVSPDVRTSPAFLRVNYILSWAWVGAFVLMLVADIVSMWWPSAPLWIGIAATFAARNAAVQFTKWYAQLARQRANAAAAGNA